ASANSEDVQELLRPLGLFRKRAEALIELASILRDRHNGSVPTTSVDLERLPSVGRYTANAFRCFRLRERVPIVDANVVRVFSRYFGLTPPRGKIDSAEEYWDLARRLVPSKNPELF